MNMLIQLNEKELVISDATYLENPSWFVKVTNLAGSFV